MKIVDCEQGSPEWVAARIGIPTASQFHRIITPKTMKPSASAGKYVAELIAEWILGMPLDLANSDLMERGHKLEEKAAQLYRLQTNNIIQTVGFILADDGKVGCSPDRLVGADGLLEIKCPAPITHVNYLLNGVDADYRCQVQGQLWITGRQWLDFFSYHPDMPEYRIRVERDVAFITALADAVADFNEQLDNARERMEELGAVPESAAA